MALPCKTRVIWRRPDCLKPSSRGWKCASSDIQRPERSHQYQANPLCFAPTFRLVDGEQRAYSRERTGRLRHARYVQRKGNSGSPKGREPYGDGVPVVVVGVTPHQGERESRLQGQVAQVFTIIRNGEVCVMQRAETLLEVIHERGKRGLPLERLHRHLFNPELYLRAYGKIYRNDGSMTPGVNVDDHLLGFAGPRPKPRRSNSGWRS